MKNSKVTFLCLIFAFVVACCADGEISHLSGKVNKDVADVGDVTISILPPKPSTSTSTTELPTSSSTTAKPPSPPTPTPSSSTTVEPTTTPPSSSTTAKPTTSPPKPPSTTSAPSTSAKPSPAPSENIWTVTNETTKEHCILMESKIVLDVTYIGNATSKQTNTSEITPSDVRVSGSCGSNSSSPSLVLTWNQFSTQNESSNITFIFNKGTENKCEYFISNITANVYVNVSMNNTTAPELLSLSFSGKEFIVHEGYSYTCANPSELKLSGSNNSTGELHLSSLHYEAFVNKKDETYSSAVDCVSHETPDIVPILVAGALILLVILVLAAYVITRRRSQARGYLSM